MLSLSSARQETYTFLSDAFARPPSPENLSHLQSDAFFTSACDLFSEGALAPLREWAQTDATLEDLCQVVRTEFMNLFKVPGGQYVAPYESVYRDMGQIAGQPVTGRLMGPSVIDVQKWYRLATVEISGEYMDLPDHICLELRYLAHLCGKEQEFSSAGGDAKLERAWEMQRDFMAGHVTNWIGALRDKVHENSNSAYYRAVADMVVEFTARDLATLEDLLGPSEGKSFPAYGPVDS
jgi:TorA maturation chaperone TorD